ncbi:Lrp/AsnC family transcriptional regulator [Paenibacillus rubinfantis]|uniref:Lrp/AsnC family transcriptional regulator n=1 Tax=Paenibacillus rubinfantis TaxID=1720296 RepID=UPI00073F9018|nr:Lrp/AsnC family transcriptional regulator [Paenibacillus rubinfantis]
MDITDQRILESLKQNSRMTASEIGKRVGLSVPAVSERIRKLEEAGIIEAYTVKINRTKTGHKLLAFVFVGIEHTRYIEAFRTKIIACGPVLECHHLAGEYDYLLKVLVEDTAHLEYFLTETLKKIPGVVKSNTMISLSTLKENINL